MSIKEPVPSFAEVTKVFQNIFIFMILLLIGWIIVGIIFWFLQKIFVHEKYDSGELNLEPDNWIEEK